MVCYCTIFLQQGIQVKNFWTFQILRYTNSGSIAILYFSFLPPTFFLSTPALFPPHYFFYLCLLLSFFSSLSPFTSPYPILTLESCYKMQLQITGPEKLPYVYRHIFHSWGFHPVGYKYPKMHMCVQMSMHKCLHANALCEKHMKSVFACVSLCLQVIFSLSFCSLREICGLALCITKRVKMNNGGRRLCQRVREQQVRKKAGLSRKNTQDRLGFATRGQTDTKIEL